MNAQVEPDMLVTKRPTPTSALEPAGVVEVRGLSKIYGNQKRGEVLAVDSVDLTVHSGELVVLLGPSGCGKTTLLRSIAGLETPSAGTIRIEGSIVFSGAARINLPPEARRIGMMFQSYALWPHMTVFGNISYPLKGLPGFDRDTIAARVADLLDRLGIKGLDRRYPGELSGGQAQRVALARALAAKPSILLFDEPLSNVDAKVRRRLRAELREIKKANGFAGVYVTHDQEEAMELADRLAVMEAGKIRQIAPTREVYDQPASIYVAGFVGELNRWPARTVRLPGGELGLETAFGRFPVSAPVLAQAGQAGWMMVRPERIRLSPARAPNSGGPLTGTVVDAIYFGSRHEFRIALPDGAEVLAHLGDDGRAPWLPQTGGRVEVSFEGESVKWLPA